MSLLFTPISSFTVMKSLKRDLGQRARSFLSHLYLCLFLLAISIAATAKEMQQDALYYLDIPATSRREALETIPKQVAGVELFIGGGDLAEARARIESLEGEFTLAQIVDLILRGSNLTANFPEPKRIVILPRASRKDVKPRKKRTAYKAAAFAQDVTRVEMEEVEVISQRSHFSYPAGNVKIIDRAHIEATGAQSLSGFWRSLPQNAFMRSEGYHTSGAQYAEMRGLGSDTALILINGRRVLPSANSLTSSAFDLNTIPSVAIDRIELLPDSASAEYGADAIGGVINIILLEDVQDSTASVFYGRAAGGAEQRRGTLRFGTSGRKFNGSAALDYFDMSGLLGSARDRWSNQDYRRFGVRDQRSLLSAAGNISSADGSRLPDLSSTFAAVPLYDPTPGISRDDFSATAGTNNLESLFRYWTLIPEAQRVSAIANASYTFSDSVTLSAEALYAERNSTFHFSPPALYGMPVAPGNAFNPFGTKVLVYRLIPELGSQYQYVESKLSRAAMELEGQRSQWRWGISAMYSNETATTWIHNKLDDDAVLQALANPDPANALNPFQSGPIGSDELLRGLVAPLATDSFGSTGQQIIAYAERSLFGTRTDTVKMRFGGERRRESGLFDSHEMGRFDRGRNVTSAFLQLRVPFIQPSMEVPGVSELLLTAGARLDKYDGIEHVISPQYGLNWKPLDSLSIGISGGRSFRPPSLYELYQPKIITPAKVWDPARNNEPADIAVIVSGNEKLQPSTGKTFSAGISFSPDTDANWRISANYWQVTMKDRAVALPPAVVLANGSLFADRIRRATRPEADGLPAPLLSVDSSRINAGRVKASGVDFFVSSEHATSMGSFDSELQATWYYSFRSKDVPGQSAVERVNLASEFGSILKLRATYTLGWQRGPYAVTTTVRYTPPYDDAVGGIRTGREISSQALIDLRSSTNVAKLLGDGPTWNGVSVIVGVDNLFDEEASKAEVGNAANFDLSQGSLLQRLYYLQVVRKF